MKDFDPRAIRRSMKGQSTEQLKKDLKFYESYRAYENERSKFIETEIKRELDRRRESYE